MLINLLFSLLLLKAIILLKYLLEKNKNREIRERFQCKDCIHIILNLTQVKFCLCFHKPLAGACPSQMC